MSFIIAQAVSELAQAREMAKQAREREDAAKKIINDNLGVGKHVVGDHLVTISETARFNQANADRGIKTHFPELWDTVTSVRVDSKKAKALMEPEDYALTCCTLSSQIRLGTVE